MLGFTSTRHNSAFLATVEEGTLSAAARALDRVLMAGNYFIPLYYLNVDYWAWWGDFGRVTAFDPIYGSVLEAWWLEP